MRLDYNAIIILLGVGFLLYSLFRRDDLRQCLIEFLFWINSTLILSLI